MQPRKKGTTQQSKLKESQASFEPKTAYLLMDEDGKASLTQYLLKESGYLMLQL